MKPFGLYRYEGNDFSIFKRGYTYVYYLKKATYIRGVTDPNVYYRHWFKNTDTGESAYINGGGFTSAFQLIKPIKQSKNNT